VADISPAHSDGDLPFGAAADDYDRLRFLPSAEAVSWLLRGDERNVLDLAAGTGQVTSQVMPLGPAVVAVEPDQPMRAVYAARFPQNECLDGTAERIPLPDGSLDAVFTEVSLLAQQRRLGAARPAAARGTRPLHSPRN
jgi:ubiquinone/menaquinone biosynthesis C-methylase UbiE